MSARMGVVLVTYNSQADIAACLNSLNAADIAMQIVVVDNASTDGTIAKVQASKQALTLLKMPQNIGFAAGVNQGLAYLMQNPALDRFWVLNPDSTCTASTPRALATHPEPFALLGCRITYADPADQIQIDAGTVNWWTGATGNMGLGCAATRPPPDMTKADFISGASMVASRAFIEAAGPMPEDYFLYYEEVDWAMRRGDLPLAFCDDARVFHAAGASIGSPTLARGPSEVSTYFKHRARLRFIARFNPVALPVAYLFGWAKIMQSLSRGQWRSAMSALRAIHGLRPSAVVRAAIGESAQAKAKSRRVRTKLS